MVPAAGESAARLLPEPGEEAWVPLTFPSIDRHTRYEVARPEDLPGRRAFRSRADCSASAMVLRLDGVDLARTPRLSWRWRIDEPMDLPGEETRAGDDFAARVYMMFRFEPEHAGMMRRAQQGLGRALYDEELPGVALSFVWASRLSAGRRWRNPFAEDSAMLALRSGRAPDDRWVREDVDLDAEHRRAFGRAPGVPAALAVMTDSDGSCSRAGAGFADFRLLPAREEATP